ncbi:DUF2922 domain-containing protein [Shouchella shacheensis]|uniref:DUF2922 domain-containing protein n=1 Tax=Shouchella shacheensis TaxID=1649580 RepID=UPI00073FF40A|nr:DUF2922 domain-containing protein [Shouchella shacheensis]
MQEQTLELRFRNEDNAIVTIRIPSPKPELTSAEIAEAMDTLIANRIFSGTAAIIQSKMDARIVSREVETITLDA